MDPFDDVFPEVPIARARVGGKFVPKAKSKQVPRKEISTLEHATLCNDGKNEHATSSSTTSDTVVNTPNKCSNPVDSTTSAKEFLKSSHSSPVKNTTNPELGNLQQINVHGDNAVLEDTLHSTIAASEVNSDWNSTNFPKAVNEADAIGSDVGLETDIIPGNNLRNASSTIIETEEPSKNWEGEGPFRDGNKSSEPIDISLQVGPDVGSKSASDYKVAMLENVHSNSNFERAGEAESAEFELDPFSNTLPDPGIKNVRKFQPKIKPRPRVSTAAVIASGSCNEILRTTDASNDFDRTTCTNMPFSEDKGSMAAVIPSLSNSPSAMLSEVAVHNGARDWPSSIGKSAGETADIFSGLESLDDFLTQAATGTAQVQKCPDYNTTQDSLNFKEAAVFNEGDTHTNSGRSGTEEVVGSNPTHPLDDTVDYSSMKSGQDSTFEIPVHEEPTNAADSPTFGDFLHVEDVSGGKVYVSQDASDKEKDATILTPPENHEKSSAVGEKDKVGKASRQLRKRATCKPVNPVENEDVEEDDLDPTYNSNVDELEEHDDECGLDNASNKKRAPNTKKKSAARNGKPPQKRKRAKKDLDRPTKEPPKKFSHSTRRRKRCVDKALLETPEDELDPQTLRIKDIILLAEYRERIAKKEATTSKPSSNNERDGGSLQEDAAPNDEIFGSGDERGSDDDQASERVPLASTLFNYQSFMDKTPSGKWTKQDTELFYEAVRQFGTDFSMVQQLFPGRTRHQIKLKYKKEERQHPLQLSDAVNNRGKDLSHFKSVIERLKQASAKSEQDPSRDASVGMTGEEVEDLTPDANEEEVPKSEQEAPVQNQEDNGSSHIPEKSDESEDDDFQRWCQYKSDY
ncbi:Transcription factor TFIIIB component B'' [Senna tora]|uniref:Transcription factor TFIIIB component B n=1 Tax=Senna tora TaxID=362788 RepID=A0A834X1N8_9FABA|nr:Transcription factor TFIIIB component B'' [Senna tora]